MLAFLHSLVPFVCCWLCCLFGVAIGRNLERRRLRSHMVELDKFIAESVKRSAILRREFLAMGIDPDQQRGQP